MSSLEQFTPEELEHYEQIEKDLNAWEDFLVGIPDSAKIIEDVGTPKQFVGFSDNEMEEVLYGICETKEELRIWIKGFLNCDLPDTCVDPDSNSNPLDMVWQLYRTAVHYDDLEHTERYLKSLFYCSRGSFKTMCACIVELMIMLHTNRNVVHIGMIESQAKNAYNMYFRPFLDLPYIQDYAKLNSILERSSLKNKDGDAVTLQIIPLTMNKTSSPRAQLVAKDEVDKVKGEQVQAYENVYGMLTMTNDKKMAMEFDISSRDSAHGMVQEIIDNSEKLGCKVRHWNRIDITERCPDSRSGNVPIPIYIKKDTLIAIGEEEYLELDTESQKYYEMEWGLEGCLSNCKMFAACFKAGTKILMSDGSVRNIEDIEEGDEVITHLGNARRVYNPKKIPFEGNINIIKHPSYSELTYVTDEHPYYINGEWKKVSNLQPSELKYGTQRVAKDYLSFPSNYDSLPFIYLLYDEFVTLKQNYGENPIKKLELDDEFAWALGYFLAEGNYKKHVNKCGIVYSSLELNGHDNEQVYRDRFHSWLVKNDINNGKSIKRSGKGTCYIVNNKYLASLFHELCGEYSYAKKIHPFILNQSPIFLEKVLEGFWCGDGQKNDRSYKEINLANETIAHQLFLIAARLGKTPKLTKEKCRKNRRQSYSMTYDYSKSKSKFIYDYKDNKYRLDSIRKEEFEGYVYNFEVEEDESYIANGIAVHNCKGYLKNQTSKCKWLKPVEETEQAIMSAPSEDMAISQLLCRTPPRTGLVYSDFSSKRNIRTPVEMYTLWNGEPPAKDLLDKNGNFTTEQLITAFKKGGLDLYLGVDAGYHHPACILIFVDEDDNVFIVKEYMPDDVDSFELAQWLADNWRKHNPTRVFVDPESPDCTRAIRKKGFNISTKVDKKRQLGIATVKGFIRLPATTLTKLYVNKECMGTKYEFNHWSYKQNPDGKYTDDASKKNDHALDAIRYVLHTLFGQARSNLAYEKDADLKDLSDEELKRKMVKDKLTPHAVAAVLGRSVIDNRHVLEEIDENADPKRSTTKYDFTKID